MATGYQGDPDLFFGPRTSGPVVSVSDFGAIGDGVSDDSAALQRAFDYIEVNGGTLEFEPSRTYVISSPVSIRNAQDFTIDGNQSTIKMADGEPVFSGNYVFMVHTSEYFEIRDLVVDGNRDARDPVEVWAHNIIIEGDSNFTFNNVTSINAVTDGFYVAADVAANAATFSRDGVFLDVTADNNFRQGMSVINAENIQILGGVFSNTNGTFPQAGIDLEPNIDSASPGIRNILIDGVTFIGNEGFGLHNAGDFGGITNVTVQNSLFSDNSLGAIRLGSSNVLVQHNLMTDFSESKRGIIDIPADVSDPSNHTIIDNLFYNINTGNPVIYVHSLAGSGHTISENQLYQYDAQGIQSFKSGTVITNNVLVPNQAPPQAIIDAFLAEMDGTVDESTTVDVGGTVEDPAPAPVPASNDPAPTNTSDPDPVPGSSETNASDASGSEEDPAPAPVPASNDPAPTNTSDPVPVPGSSETNASGELDDTSAEVSADVLPVVGQEPIQNSTDAESTGPAAGEEEHEDGESTNSEQQQQTNLDEPSPAVNAAAPPSADFEDSDNGNVGSPTFEFPIAGSIAWFARMGPLSIPAIREIGFEGDQMQLFEHFGGAKPKNNGDLVAGKGDLRWIGDCSDGPLDTFWGDVWI